MGNNCIAGFYIQLTNDASKIPMLKNTLLETIRIFRSFPRAKAADVLFRLNYGTAKDKKTALGWFAYANQNSEFPISGDVNPTLSKTKNFTDEDFEALAKELQIQYQEYDPGFLSIDSIRGIPRECKKELDALQEKLADSPLLLFLAVSACAKAQKKPYASQWCLELFAADLTSRVNVLKNLGLNFNSRLLLTPFSKEIGMLLLSMHQTYVAKQELLNSHDALVLPLAKLLKILIDQNQFEDENEETNNSYKIDEFETAVVKFIKQSQGINSSHPDFDTFVEYQQKLEALGQSIFYVLSAKRNYIKISHIASNALFVAATNPALFKELSEAEIALNKARAVYKEVYTDFQNFCLENFEDR